LPHNLNSAIHAQHWRPVRRLRQGQVPIGLRPWLLDPGSLTRRLQRRCPEGGFRVELLAQHMAIPLACERQRLGLRSGQRVLVREVRLCCGERPWVYARSLIPSTALRGPLRHLRQIGERPLGAVLFADPGLRRDELEVVRVDPRRELPRVLVGLTTLRGESEVWGRRSLFWLRGAPLMVSEYFLPGLPEGPQ